MAAEVAADLAAGKYVPARCKVCDRRIGAVIDGEWKPMLVPPGEERSGPTGPQYRCHDRAECARYVAKHGRGLRLVR